MAARLPCYARRAAMPPSPIDFQAFFEQSPTACLVLAPDAAFTIVAVTDAYLRATLRRREELVGQGLFEAFPDDPAGPHAIGPRGLRASLEQVLATRAPDTPPPRRYDLPRPDGGFEERYWSTRTLPLLGRDGQVRYLLHQVEDVTQGVRLTWPGHAGSDERERLLSETEAANAQLEAIFQSIPDALYVGGADGIWRANAPALAQLGFRSTEELNRSIGTLAREIQTRRVDTGAFIPVEEQAFTHALQGRADVQEVRVRHLTTGEERVVRSSCAPIRVGSEVIGAVGINTDITQQKAAEAALRARADFEQQLIAIVSHDLKNPLHAILLGTASLLRRGHHDERTLKFLRRIQESAERATRLVNDLLDFTQARLGGGIPVQPQDINLHDVIRHAVEEVQIAYAERTLQLHQEGDVRGHWDPDRLAQVVTNLVTNAVKYSPPGTPVTVTTREESNRVVLEVHNGGTPIPPEKLERLFAPMQRGSTLVDPAGRSVGLGLYIVEQLVRAHGGTLGVTSTAGEGTTVTVRLPRRPPAPP
jgi:PAS domain S-box-containing protein